MRKPKKPFQGLAGRGSRIVENCHRQAGEATGAGHFRRGVRGGGRKTGDGCGPRDAGIAKALLWDYTVNYCFTYRFSDTIQAFLGKGLLVFFLGPFRSRREVDYIQSEDQVELRYLGHFAVCIRS